jgi:hypothetical protein
MDKVLLNDNEILRFSNRGTVEAVELTREKLSIVNQKRGQVPAPVIHTVGGMVDVLSYSDHTIKLKTLNNEVVPLRLEKAQLQEFKDYFGQLIAVRGTVHYKQNRVVSYMDNLTLIPNEQLAKVTSKRPDRLTMREKLERQIKDGKLRNSLQDFFGIWPSDETDEEWEQMIKSLKQIK